MASPARSVADPLCIRRSIAAASPGPSTPTIRSRSRPSGPSRRTDPNRNPTALATSGSAPTRATTSGENPVNWVVSMTSSASRVESDASTCAFADSPRIATIPTSARPMTSALAVAAVRRGLRIAFPRAMAPGTPAAARTGAPNARASERANTASSTTMPKRRRIAPSPTVRSSEIASSADCDRTMPTTRIGTLTPTNTSPTVARRRKVSLRASGRSVIAAIGGMRAARIAGQSAAPTVTNRPTAMAYNAVRGSTTTSPLGMRNPSESTSDMRSRATKTPSTRPPSDAIAPTTAASSTTAAITCRRAAAHGPQEPELARALRDEDRERVEDDEATDDESQRCESEEQTGEEVDELADVLVVRTRHDRGVGDVEVGTERRAEGTAQGVGFDAGGAPHVDRIEEAGRGGDPLRGRQIERGEREGSGVGAVADDEQSDDLVRLAWPGRQHVDRVADAESADAGGVAVDRDLGGTSSAPDCAAQRRRRGATVPTTGPRRRSRRPTGRPCRPRRLRDPGTARSPGRSPSPTRRPRSPGRSRASRRGCGGDRRRLRRAHPAPRRRRRRGTARRRAGTTRQACP